MNHLFNYSKLLSACLVLLCTFNVFAKIESKAIPDQKNAISAETGIYSISTTTSSASGLGLFSLEYLRVINMKWAGSLSYSQFVTDPGSVSSNIFGYDLVVHWCWKACRPYKKEEDSTNASYFPRWSYIIQGGLSQRFIQLDERTVGFNGLRVGGEVQYFKQSPLAWYGRTYIARLTNGTSDMNVIAITAGARWWF
ncbi:MAG TPA: hypothetical protein VNJ08_17820 [Bacteriovoracaceae bacterium]|nr:hypothetical protein [Bacteriovoracaceae bacterium]